MMKFNNDFFLKTSEYNITHGYNYGDKHYYIVIIFNNFFERKEHLNVYQAIFGINYGNNESAYIFNMKYDGENGDEVHKTIITQKIEKKEKIFVENKDYIIKIGIVNDKYITTNYIKCELNDEFKNNKYIFDSNCTKIKKDNNKISYFKFIYYNININ